MIDFKRENDDDQPLPNTEYPHNTCVVTDDICVTPVSMRDDGKCNIHHSLKVNVARGTLIVPVAHERGHILWKFLSELDGVQYFKLRDKDDIRSISRRYPIQDKKYEVFIRFLYDAFNKEEANHIATEMAFMAASLVCAEYDLEPVRERKKE